LLHPTRYRIVELLAERPRHIDGISRVLDVKKGLVAYHFMVLEERGFVKSNYGIFILLEPEQRGTALRVYTATDKVADVKAKLKKEL
jgi:predicted transcriptional regulator